MKRLKIGIGVLLMALSSIGCSNFLDETPDNRTKIDNVQKVSELVTLAYPDGIYFQFADLSSDNAYDSQKTQYENVTNTETFFWDVIRSESVDTPTHYWNVAYKAIAQANTAIEAGEKMLADFENRNLEHEVKRIKGILAEAYIARAYSHFTLVNLFSKAYNPNTASSELGIPYVFEVESVVLQNYDRGTVQSTYDKIEEDLLNGLKWIGYREAESNLKKYHFNTASAKAFAARFYNYKGEFEESLKYSAIAIDGRTLRNKVAYAEEGDEVQTSMYASPLEEANLLISTVESNVAVGAGGRFSYTATVANKTLFSRTTNPFGGDWSYTTLAFTATDKLYIPKTSRIFKVTDPTNQLGLYYANVVLFSTDMLYLDRIEALINENELGEALEMLSVFTVKSTKGAAGKKLTNAQVEENAEKSTTVIDPFYVGKLNDQQIAYLKYLSDLRRRDSYMEGARFFDVKRYGMPVVHESTAGSLRSETLLKDDNRGAFQIPNMAIEKGIVPNPR